MWNDPGELGNYTGKLFEYLGSGRPILMLGYEHGVAAELIREREAGFVANDPQAIAAALSRWIELKRTRGFVPGTSEGVTSGLTRREQTAVLSGLLESVLSERGSHRDALRGVNR
jgi:glycosyltransferase involved in cell wall biosynthesis